VSRERAKDVGFTTRTRRSVLLVDDHRAFRVAVRSVLDAEPTYTVVAEATDGEEAVALARRLRPDLVLMDVRLPGINGIEATRRILAQEPLTTGGAAVHGAPLGPAFGPAGVWRCRLPAEGGGRPAGAGGADRHLVTILRARRDKAR
jgi:CheY-like chemotaxis protein